MRTGQASLFWALNLASAACAIGAVVALCLGVKEGWGWLLFTAYILHTSPEVNSDNSPSR